MPSRSKSTSVLALRRVAPALIAADLVREGRRHWKEQLSERQQRRLVALLKQSHGDPRKLSAKEQRELKSLARDLDLRSFAKTAVVSAVSARAKGRLPKR